MAGRSIEELRRAARRRLPRAAFGFIEGGAEDEMTVAANRAGFDEIRLVPRVFRDVADRSLVTTVGGIEMAAPIMAAPAGLLGPLHPDGELAGAVAAARLGLIGVVSPMSTLPLEEIAAASATPPWFNIFPFGDRARMAQLLDRAGDAGCAGLVYSSDMAAPGNRERDKRNGFIAPPKITGANLLGAVTHPAWTVGLLRSRRVTLQNFHPGKPPLWGFLAAAARSTSSAMRTLNPRMTWDDLDFLRSRWSGVLAVKGPTNPDDAREMVKRGVDVVIVGNHGGRQLDHVRSSIEQLPAVVDAVGSEVDVVLDGGVRRGSDVAKALAIGARACMVGRPWVYGMAANGTAGAEEALTALVRELGNVMALLGVRSPGELRRSDIARAGVVI